MFVPRTKTSVGSRSFSVSGPVTCTVYQLSWDYSNFQSHHLPIDWRVISSICNCNWPLPAAHLWYISNLRFTNVRIIIIIDSPQLCWRWIYTIGCYYYDFFFFLLLLFFCPRFQLILGQTHDEMENWKLATHICESFRPSSLIDQYPITW